MKIHTSWAMSNNFKIIIPISDEAEKFGGIQHFCLMEKIGHFTFYGDQYMNLVKS